GDGRRPAAMPGRRRKRLSGQAARRRQASFARTCLDAALMMGEMAEAPDDIELNLLLEAIRRRYGYDFAGYSRSSVARRLQRAQSHFGCESLSMLQHKVLHEPSIIPDLLNLMTVQVSEMFRDPSYFRALRETVIPHLRTYPSLKVWVAGCSDGEELYSLAILFREEGLEEKTIFYATDVRSEE